MSNNKYPKGSEWRKWDLHVHTPYSHLNNGFGNNFNTYAKNLIKIATKSEVAVVGITDYFTIEGYRKLKQLLADETAAISVLGEDLFHQKKHITFFPNIELRSSTLITTKSGQTSRVNYHIIFSDDVSCDDIENHFLREVKFFNQTAPGQDDESWPLTTQNLTELGARLKNEHKKFSGSDIYVGMINACIDPATAIKALNNKASVFSKKFLVFIPIDEDLRKLSWDGQGHLTRKSYIQKAHCVFSSNKGTRDFSLGKKSGSVEDYLKEFKSLKPCFHSSDSHCFDTLFEPQDPDGNPSGLYTWVKADPTFPGLLQTLVEPELRVYIGEEPPNAERVRNNRTKYIDSISLKPASDSRTDENWFNQSIEFNTGLCCIIGNKGSGKSALADIAGLMGDTAREDKFSFLNRKKFRNKRRGKAQYFVATLKWLSSVEVGPRRLSEDVDNSKPESVRYIPQNFLEDLCNELTEGKESQFYNELEKVIFSHIKEDQKLGRTSLSDLLEYLSGEKQEAIDIDLGKIEDINRHLEALEKECTAKNLQKVSSLIEKLETELKAHNSEDVKPNEVKPPQEDKETLDVISDQSNQISEKNKSLEELDNEIQTANKKLAELNSIIAAAKRLLDKIINFESVLGSVYDESLSDASIVRVDMKAIIDVQIDKKPIKNAIEAAQKDKESIQPSLDPENPDSLTSKRAALLKEIESLKEKLTEPQKRYQKYLEDIKKWNHQKKGIEGDAGTPGSLCYEKERKRRIEEENPIAIEKLKAQRLSLVAEIFDKKEEIKSIYAEHYKAVTDFINSDRVPKGNMFRLAFDVTIKEHGFEEKFLNYIHRGKTGSFYGEDDGAKRLREIIENVNFDDKDSVLSFVENIDEHLHFNKRDSDSPKIDVFSQLKGKASFADVYQALFSLDYLKPEYRLTWGCKEISQLSPGERGTLLLIFYLSIDRDDIPLIVDQPEENLDNQTVYDVLVPCIEKAKEHRQIIIVTHNPNLAVVCDAEQIIYANIFKEDKNRVEYVSGSIENPAINRRIVDILEGTKPAFNNREQKYKNCEQ